MNWLKLLVSVAALVLTINSVAQAQVSVDMSKFTCEQLTSGPPGDAIETGVWLSGYYNGQRKNTVLELKQVKQNAEAVVKHCKANPKMTVMQAVDTLLAVKK